MTSITGRVTVQRRASVGAPTVELINSSADIVDQVQVSDDGGFVFHVSPGIWHLRAYDAQAQRGEATAEVGEEETKIPLELL